MRGNWRWVAVAVLIFFGLSGRPSLGATQANGAASLRVAGDRQESVCDRFQALLERVGDRGSARRALAARLDRYGCGGTGTTTTSMAPGTSTTSIVSATTTTTFHVDCPLPGGGVGPCPTTTTLPSGTTSTSVVPGGTTSTSTVPGGTTTTTVGPGGTTSTVPGGTTTTLPPCPSTTSTTGGPFPTTTIPTCMP